MKTLIVSSATSPPGSVSVLSIVQFLHQIITPLFKQHFLYFSYVVRHNVLILDVLFVLLTIWSRFKNTTGIFSLQVTCWLCSPKYIIFIAICKETHFTFSFVDFINFSLYMWRNRSLLKFNSEFPNQNKCIVMGRQISLFYFKLGW